MIEGFRNETGRAADALRLVTSGSYSACGAGIVPAVSLWETSRHTRPRPKVLMQKKPGTRDTLPQIDVHEADLAQDMGDTTAARYSDLSVPTSVWRPRTQTTPRLLLARSDESIGPILAPLQDVMGTAVIDEVVDGNQLDEALQKNGPYALVISQAILPGMRGLEVLAKARERGDNTPFVLIQSMHQNFVRITIGGGPNSIVSTRLVNTVALLDLVQQMLSAKSLGKSAQ